MKLDFFKRADILGEPVSLSVAGRDTHQTYLGALLSLVYIGLTLAAGIIIAQQYFDTTNPSVVQTTQESSQYPEIDLYANSFGQTILIFDSAFGLVPSDQVYKYVKFTATHTEQVMGVDAAGQFSNKRTETNLPMVPCKDLDSESMDIVYGFIKSDANALKVHKDNGICLKPDKNAMAIRGKPTDIVSKDIKVVMMPCDSSTGQCVSKATISGTLFMVISPKYSLDVSNKMQPAKAIPTFSPPIPINLEASTKIYNSMKMTTIQDSAGFLFPDVVRGSFADVGSYFSFWSVRDSSVVQCDYSVKPLINCDSYYEMSFISSGTSVSVQRSYKGIVESFGDFGGVKEVIVLILGFLYSYYQSKSQDLFVRDQVFKTKKHLQDYVDFITKKNRLLGKEKKKLQKKIIDAADDAIGDCLDVVTLVREICKVRMLFEVMFDKNSEQAQPLVALTLSKKRESESEDKDLKETLGMIASSSTNGTEKRQKPVSDDWQLSGDFTGEASSDLLHDVGRRFMQDCLETAGWIWLEDLPPAKMVRLENPLASLKEGSTHVRKRSENQVRPINKQDEPPVFNN